MAEERSAMRARAKARLAWGLWAAFVALAVGLPLLASWALLNPGFGPTEVFGDAWLLSAALLPFATVGALIAARRPENAIGWLMLAMALLWDVGVFSEAYEQHERAVTGTLLNGWIVWCAYWVTTPGWMLMFVHLPLRFPDGRLPSQRWRPIAWLGMVLLLAATVAWGIDPDVAGDERVPAIVRRASETTLASVVEVVVSLAVLVAVLGAVASFVARFRQARGVKRQQLKWFTLVIVLITTGLLLSALPVSPANEISWDLALAGAFLGVPAVIGIAILRHQLYDIDRIINRTLVYGLLTAGLGALYVGSVVGLPRLLGPLTSGSDLIVAGSTLAVAGLFRPARGRVQRIVDRRFYRRGYDAAKTVEVFSARLRNEVDLDTLVAELEAVVRETMQPVHVSLWLRQAGE